MSERDRRVAENQSIFRDVNELRPVSGEEATVEFLCECGLTDCDERIALVPAEYESVRVDSRQFVIRHGHELLENEDVVSRDERFLVVRKFGEAGEVADERDSRSSAAGRRPDR